MNRISLALTVNGQPQSLEIRPDETLLRVLRDHLGLTGTKEGCGSGECGSCLVVLDGLTVNACLVPAAECDGSVVETIEGLAPARGRLHPVQDAFVRHGAVQCGYCTPGVLLAAKALLEKDPKPTREMIKEGLSGNLCRCTGYKKIVDAVEALAQGSAPPVSEGEFNVGRSSCRPDALEHVQGASIFGADVGRPNMVYGKILRSAHPHARIKGIDTGEAESLEGVLAVVTGREVPEGYYGVDIKDQLVLARDKVRFRGEAVAAVAALSEETALRAVERIKVDYEPLEPIFDAEAAMERGAPLIHERLSEYACGFQTETRGNVCTVAHVKVGDVEKGFSEADIVMEDTFSTQIQHQASLETHAAVAEVDALGRVTVWSTTQKPFAIRRYLHQSLQIPMNRLRVVATRIGGGFGGKLELNVEPYAVVLAQKSGRPVKIVYSRAEEFASTNPRHSASFWVKSGVKKDGTLVARRVRLVYDTGAYSGNGPTTVTLSAQLWGGLYRVPNFFLEGYCVYTNKMNCGSMRGPSGPQTTFALESHTDNLAHRLGMDPLDFRLKNLLEPGEKTAVGQSLVDVDFKKVVCEAAETIGWREIPKEKNVGRGMACMFWLSGGWATSVTVRVNEDGTVGILTGAVDMGTGYLYTSVPQLVAEELGLRAEDVHLTSGDTDTTVYDHGIGGSRGAFTVGKAAFMAAAKVKEELLKETASRLEVTAEELAVHGGRVFLRTDTSVGLSFAEISFARHMHSGGPLACSANYLPEMDSIDETRVEGLSFSAFKGNSLACHAALVEVDPETGLVAVRRYVAAHDVGRAINPRAAEGQIEGGVSMGLGFALTESLGLDGDGRILNPNFADYKIPSVLDVPETEAVLVEVPAAYGPYGAKGLGEPTMGPPAAAVANAIYDALGVRLCRTPMTPEEVWRAIECARGRQ